MKKKQNEKKPTKYIVTDGELVLELEKEGKWYSVTSPFNPAITTQGRTLEEAFEMARDVLALFAEDRAEQATTSEGPTKKTG
jgi:predicted RNase H-like HicB family nuclease